MRRSLEKEMMDLPGNPLHVFEQDLRNLRTINRTLGAARGLLGCLRRWVKTENPARFSLLDIGTGYGDIPVAVVRWARRMGISARVVGLEPHPVTVGMARRYTIDLPEISIVRGDGFDPPFSCASFDFVHTSQVLHHFSGDDIVTLLRAWSGLARRGIMVSDLIRHPLAYHGIRLLTRLFSTNPMTRTDGPLSVQRAFTLTEWEALFFRAGIGEFHASRFFPFRVFALIESRR